MKTIFCLIAVLFSASFCSAQKVGIGIGTGGASIKYNPADNFRLIGRINPLFTNLPLDVDIINGSIVAGYVLLKEAAGMVYLGAGAGTATTEYSRVVAEKRWFLNVPLGLELFPLTQKRFSFAAEAGPQLDMDGETDTRRFSFKGLFEFSYYLGR